MQKHNYEVKKTENLYSFINSISLPVLHPDSLLKKFFDLLNFFFLMINIFYIPMNMGFDIESSAVDGQQIKLYFSILPLMYFTGYLLI